MTWKAKERTTEHPSTALKWPLQITLRFLAQNVERDGLRVVEVLEAHNTLDEERLGVAHVSVEAAHHKDAEIG